MAVGPDDEDELDGETSEEVQQRLQRQLASMPRQFSGANWQTLGAGTGALSGSAPSYLVSNVSHSGQASYVNASQLLQTTASG